MKGLLGVADPLTSSGFLGKHDLVEITAEASAEFASKGALHCAIAESAGDKPTASPGVQAAVDLSRGSVNRRRAHSPNPGFRPVGFSPAFLKFPAVQRDFHVLASLFHSFLLLVKASTKPDFSPFRPRHRIRCQSHVDTGGNLTIYGELTFPGLKRVARAVLDYRNSAPRNDTKGHEFIENPHFSAMKIRDGAPLPWRHPGQCGHEILDLG